MSQREADGFDAATKVSLDRFESLAAEARDTLVEETRRALAALQATAEDSAHRRRRSRRSGPDARRPSGRSPVRRRAKGRSAAADSRIDSARRIVAETSQSRRSGRRQRDREARTARWIA
jgi:hypothetical protein